MKNGLNKGVAEDGISLTKHVEIAKKNLISKALDTLGILLDSPTASGSAGNSGKFNVPFCNVIPIRYLFSYDTTFLKHPFYATFWHPYVCTIFAMQRRGAIFLQCNFD